MKNKTTIYCLMAGALLVWGLIFYKIFSGLGESSDSALVTIKKKVIHSQTLQQEQPLVLITHYRDPFLGNTSGAIVSREYNEGENSFRRKSKKTEVIDWNFIDYIGIVQNKETKKKVGMVVVSGKEYIVNEQEAIEGVTILRKERDSVLVKFRGSKKWIRR